MTSSRQRIRCGMGSSLCHLDQDSGILTFINFKPMYTGEYELEFIKDLSNICTYQFNLTEAGKNVLLELELYSSYL